MSHEQMLAWLDQANAGVVSGAADRLKKAATEIQSIADELKVRPQWVAWKGEGADAFRTWAADLANATLRLSDFSRDSGTWLSHASDAISLAQSAIPRDLPGATANLAAANAAHNDPDAASIASKSSAELAALKADREKVRLEAATQMNKLAQSYSWSATQLNSLERPKLPPPPKAFLPPDVRAVDSMRDKAPTGDSGSAGGGSALGSVSTSRGVTGDGSTTGKSPERHASGASAPLPHASVDAVLPPTRTAIDSVGTLPSQTPVQVPHTPVDPGPLKGGVQQSLLAPPLFGTGQVLPGNNPVVQGRATGAGTIPMPSTSQGTGTATPVGRIPNGVGGGNGIVGGRPVLPSESRPTGAIPRGTVVGGEGVQARGPMGQTTGMTNPVGRAAGVSGATSGNRPVSSPGGVVGGRPAVNSAVVGGDPARQPRRTGGRIPGSGAIGAGGEGTRNPTAGGTTSGGSCNAASPASRPPQGTPPAQTRNGSGRPYGVTEDEETWRRNQRPTVPPVVE
ncbi:WXG100 family type VII secretion target [Streptomyces roseirectus]|nr:translation initiation factor IF-2 [Streptomyces roseirectus]